MGLENRRVALGVLAWVGQLLRSASSDECQPDYHALT
jgi:hypothetical protein